MTRTLNTRKTLEVFFLAVVLFGSLTGSFSDRLYAAPKAEASSQIGQVINVNKAGLEELQTVRGIGPALAERIIQYRDEHGPFKKLDDVTSVRGIGKVAVVGCVTGSPVQSNGGHGDCPSGVEPEGYGTTSILLVTWSMCSDSRDDSS